MILKFNSIIFKFSDYYVTEESSPDSRGTLDDVSKTVLVKYVDINGYINYSLGYTDWDGDGFYWNLSELNNIKPKYKKLLSWAYLSDLGEKSKEL